MYKESNNWMALLENASCVNLMGDAVLDVHDHRGEVVLSIISLLLTMNFNKLKIE